MPVSFRLNGRDVTLDVPPDRRVVDVLREDLGLVGTKEGCGSGDCGACTIMVDGESRLSCLMLAVQLEDRSVVTIEGLASQAAGPFVSLRDAFVRHGAVQCGFCTPGMMLAALDLLGREPGLHRGGIREGLSGNLCRCTGYTKIVDAIEATAGAGSNDRGEGRP